MKITSLSAQLRDPSRVNVSIDGKYRFSLDIAQVIDLGIKQGQDIDEDQLAEYMRESEFGKLYARTLEYCLMRPRSAREVRDYLYKKTFARKYKTRKGEIKDREGVSVSITERVFDRLVQKGYIDDQKFAQFWVENRNQRKGTSMRKLRNELMAKGVDSQMIDAALVGTERSDDEELQKMIIKKQSKYDDEQKLIAYLIRQGFSYDSVRSALARTDDD